MAAFATKAKQRIFGFVSYVYAPDISIFKGKYFDIPAPTGLSYTFSVRTFCVGLQISTITEIYYFSL